MHTHKILNIASPDKNLQNIISKQVGTSRILAQVLINRGITSIDEAAKFLSAKFEHLLDPYSFSDMNKAVNLVKKALKNKDPVMVFADYDVDGITSLTLLKSTLSKMGLNVSHYLPHRVKEGYGLNNNVMAIIKEKNIKLFITADCGTNNEEEIKELKRRNIEVIVTDHHEPENEASLPSASAVINPKVKSCGYKYRDLAGVGVAYKFCQAVTGSALLEDLDLVSLGTVADVVPLTGENRIIVKEGLSRISCTKRLGLKALMETSGIKGKEITSHSISYILGPRLNASGRMDNAQVSLDLLMAEQEGTAGELARIIETHNRQRQKIEEKIMVEAQDLIEREINFKEHKVIIVAKEGWHQGVLGVVASKLADRFYRPTIIISLDKSLCRGSGRSIKNFHLFDALLECKDFLSAFGGHSHAVGLGIIKENIEGFKNKINDLANERLSLEDLLPSLDIDMELNLSELDAETIKELEALEPFGSANPAPLFYTKGLRLKGEPQVLGRGTLKFWVTDGEIVHQAIGFGMAAFKDSLLKADSFGLVYKPKIDNWHGDDSVLLEARDIFFR